MSCWQNWWRPRLRPAAIYRWSTQARYKSSRPGWTLHQPNEYQPSSARTQQHFVDQPPSVFVLHRDWIRTSGDRYWSRPEVQTDYQRRCWSGIALWSWWRAVWWLLYTESPGSFINNPTFQKIWPGIWFKSGLASAQHAAINWTSFSNYQTVKAECWIWCEPCWRMAQPFIWSGYPDTRCAAAYDNLSIWRAGTTGHWITSPWSSSAFRTRCCPLWCARKMVGRRGETNKYVALYKVGEPSRKEPTGL